MICDFYTALTAWGTVGAVLVALFYPICRESKDNREKARILRKQLLVKIAVVECASRQLPNIEQFGYSTEESRRTSAEISALFPQTAVLTSEEQAVISKLFLLLATTPEWPKAESGRLTEIWKAADTAFKSLRRIEAHAGKGREDKHE